tara:strand:- start:3521 stop:3826 length:306 start_codon:yes stop_codon:yes gene_type:complete
MKLKPVHDKIVVKQMTKKGDEVTEAGIILPDTVDQGELIEGEVLSAGHGVYSQTGDLIPICVEMGDRILYSKNAQTQPYKLNGEEVLIMSQNEILSIITEE